jgi:hypothetical protein
MKKNLLEFFVKGTVKWRNQDEGILRRFLGVFSGWTVGYGMAADMVIYWQMAGLRDEIDLDD